MPVRRPPAIGITCNVQPPRDEGLYPGLPLEYCDRSLVQGVWRAGGTPLLLPVDLPDLRAAPVRARQLLAGIDGLLLSGGEDLTAAASPAEGQGHAPGPGDALHAARDRLELALLAEARQRGVPVLGVCRGLQLVCVASGGALWADLPTQRPGPVPHRDGARYLTHRHPVTVQPGSLLASLVDGKRCPVSSAHHQGVRLPGAGLRVAAIADDGLVEALESVAASRVLAVQWHPEWLGEAEPAGGGLFRWLVEVAAVGGGDQTGRITESR